MAKSKSRAGTSFTSKQVKRENSIKSLSSNNPFERNGQRVKNRVVGRKVHGADRKSNVARTMAVKQRKSALLKEWKQWSHAKDNVFVDRRFGIDDESLTETDRAAVRFQKERQKQSKFELNENGQEEQMTHLGASLSTVLHGRSRIDLEEEDQPSGSVLPSTYHDAPRTKREVMHEIIQKSKMYKAQAQQEAEDQKNRVEELDKEFLKVHSELLLGQPRLQEEQNQEEDIPMNDAFDVKARELKLEAKVAASDRTKTPEEIAEENRLKLEKLETERKKRMCNEYALKNEKTSLSAETEEVQKGTLECEIDPEFLLSDTDDEEEDDMDEEIELLNLTEEEQERIRIENKKEELDQEDLPFTLSIPESLQALEELVQGRSSEDLRKAIYRIRAYNDKALGNDTSIKLQKFYGILWKYYLKLTENIENLSVHEGIIPKLNVLCVCLLDMANDYPLLSCTIAQQRLNNIRSYVATYFKWCTPAQCLQLLLFTHLFPGTDYRHPVTIPTLLTLSHWFTHLPLTSSRDLAIALTLAKAMLRWVGDSHRILPELVGFISRLLQHDTSSQTTDSQFASLPSNLFDFNCSDETDFKGFDIADICENVSFEKESFIKTVRTCVRQLTHSLLAMYNTTSSFPEMAQMLGSIGQEALSTGFERCRLQRARQVVMIEQETPKFDENFDPSRDKDPDKRRVALKKLEKKVRSERKGARRELRRDAAFVEAERRAELQQEQVDRQSKQREIRTFLEQQQRDSNILRKEKRRKK